MYTDGRTYQSRGTRGYFKHTSKYKYKLKMMKELYTHTHIHNSPVPGCFISTHTYLLSLTIFPIHISSTTQAKYVAPFLHTKCFIWFYDVHRGSIILCMNVSLWYKIITHLHNGWQCQKIGTYNFVPQRKIYVPGLQTWRSKL